MKGTDKSLTGLSTRSGEERHGLTTLCLSLALLLGLFFPTSIHAEISKGLGYVCSLALFGIYVGLAMGANCLAGPPLIVCFLTINGTLLLATLLSPLSSLAPGAYAFYFLLSCLYLLDLRRLAFNRFLEVLFTVSSIILLVLAFASILPIEQVVMFFISNYSVFYPELLPAMFRLGKPVLMFGSHSLAGFFYCVCFLLNFLTYTYRKT
ncbi:MAG: hypothetical protein Q8N47_25000, partial [Bryobacterales bacterium]|nr:hypothetical protein [Bryobacterales bacterium]